MERRFLLSIGIILLGILCLVLVWAGGSRLLRFRGEPRTLSRSGGPAAGRPRRRGSVAARVPNLLDAVRRAPQDAQARASLAAAYLARSAADAEPFDLVMALAQTDQALALDPRQPESRFNRALALERLSLRSSAHAAWEEYLEFDSTSDAAEEARLHLAATAEPKAVGGWDEERGRLTELGGDPSAVEEIVAQFPQSAREYVEDELLGAWADAVASRRHEPAFQALALARRIGVALVQRKGEHLAADEVAAIDRATSEPAVLSALVDGHRAYRDARQLHQAHRTSDARPLFERARRALAQGGSPLAAWASLYLAVGQEERNEFRPALETLGGIVRDPGTSRYPGLRVRAYWVMGLVDLGAGAPADSLTDYLAALPIAEQAGLIEDAAGLHAVLAEDYRFLGQPRETWRHLLSALAALPQIRTPRRLHAILSEAADACEAASEWGVARYFRDAEVRVARAGKDPAALSHALLQRSRTGDRLGNPAAADRDLGEARQVLAQIPDPALRQRNLANLLMVESDLVAGRDPVRAAAALDRSLAYYGGQQNHFALSRLFLAHARVALASGDEVRAEADLRRGIAEVEQLRRRVPDETMRISFFEHSRSLFDTMIGLAARHRDRGGLALDYAERERARALLDRMGALAAAQQDRVLAQAPEPLRSDALRRELPRGIAVVEYALLDDRLLTWVLRQDGITFHQVESRLAVVEGEVSRLNTGLEHRAPAGELTEASSALFDRLIRPILSDLAAADRLVFVPDKVLHAVPFVALRDRETGHYLIEDRTVGVAPSATLYLAARQRVREESARPPTALAVGNPSFDRRVAPQLADLRESAAEAARLASLFPGSELLVAERATKEALLAAAGRHEILHFGGHAVINSQSPLLSYLLLAPGTSGDSGFLYAWELYGMRLARTRLAILAACSTARGPVTEEGVLSLARAFLAAGVPTVVASLWEVGDAPSGRLFRLFHQNLGQGRDPAAALRAAQVTLLQSSDATLRDPASWAAFEVLGAIPPPTTNPKEK